MTKTASGEKSPLKIHILSDLHLEFAPVQLAQTDADVVIMAGDINLKLKGLYWMKAQFSKKPVLYVLGNHEFYGTAHPRLVEKAKIAAVGTNISILENDEVVIGRTRFLGCTLWTDFELFGDPRVAGYTASKQMTDFHRIRRSPSYSKLRSIDAAVIHKRSLEWLKTKLETKWVGPTVVITHHAPSPQSVPERFRKDIVSASYASNLEDTVKQSRASLWIHGHIHHGSDYVIGDTRVICNPKGYPVERNTDFNPTLVIELR